MFENKTEQQKTKAVLICADTGEFDAKASIDELEELAETAEAETVLKVIQKREVIDNATVIGSGRLEEVRREAEMLGAETYLYLMIADTQFTARVHQRSTSKIGDTIKVGFEANKIHFFDKDTEVTILN